MSNAVWDGALQVLQRAHDAGHLFVWNRHGHISVQVVTSTGQLADMTKRGADLVALLQFLDLWGAEGEAPDNGKVRRFLALLAVLPQYHVAVDHMTAHHVIHRPTLLRHGSAYVSPPRGYCHTTRTYSFAEPIQPRPVEDSPLREFLDAFALDGAGRAKVLAFYTGTLIRQCFGPMPALLIRSPYKNTGKSTLIRLAASMYHNTDEPPTMTWKGSTEFSKELSAYAAAPPFFWIDNVDTRGSKMRSFTSDAICTATQTGHIQVRILGESHMVTIDRPTFGVTVQGGRLDQDLIDRLLYVRITERPSEVLAKDMLVFAKERWQDIRDELAMAIMQTQPDTELPSRRFRFNDFYRHVAPVLRLYGYNPEDLTDQQGNEAQADMVELSKLLARLCEEDAKYFGPDDILAAGIKAWEYSNLAMTVSAGDSKAAQRAQLKALLRDAPDTIEDQESRYRWHVVPAAGGYKARVETEEK